MQDLISWPEGDGIGNIMPVITPLSSLHSLNKKIKKLKAKVIMVLITGIRSSVGRMQQKSNHACSHIHIQSLLLHKKPKSNSCQCSTHMALSSISEKCGRRLMMVQIQYIKLNLFSLEFWSALSSQKNII